MSAERSTPRGPLDVSDGSEIDQRIKSSLAVFGDLAETWLLWERDFEAFCTWIGAPATREMYRKALAMVQERTP